MKRILVLGGVVGLALTIASCGNGKTDVESGASTESHLSELFEQIDGGLSENQAAQLLARRHQQEAVQACMAERGQEYVLDVLDAPVWSTETFRIGHGGTEWLQPLYDDFNLADSDREAAQGEVDLQDKSYLDKLAPDDRAVYDAALDKCASAGDSAFVLFPKAHESLRSSLLEVLLPYDKAAGERAGEYAECLAENGFNAKSPVELFETVSAEFIALNKADSNYTRSDEFASAAAVETAAASADSSCRSDIYYDALAEANSDIQAWAVKHSSELAELDSQWAKWVKEAEGYPEANRVLDQS